MSESLRKTQLACGAGGTIQPLQWMLVRLISDLIGNGRLLPGRIGRLRLCPMLIKNCKKLRLTQVGAFVLAVKPECMVAGGM